MQFDRASMSMYVVLTQLSGNFRWNCG